ncbi:MAG: septum formation initiator family protein [Candidatus Paceibacterota bacterium]
MDRHIRKERWINKVIRNPFSYVVLISLLVLFSYSAISTYKKSRVAKEKTRQVESELQKLEDQEADLKNSLNDMNTPFGVEKSLREKFGIIKAGEKSIIVIDAEEGDKSEKSEENRGFFNFIKNIF